MASFDIFDTVLVRAVPSASVLQREVHARAVARGLIDCGVATFLTGRQAAERTVREDRDHVVLELIYRELGHRHNLALTTVAQLHQLELEVEAEGLGAVPGVERLLMEARRSTGRGVLFLSDMHLPPLFLKQQLERLGCWSPGDKLWVSGVAGSRKRDGGLFVAAAEVEGVDPGQFIHRGDDPITDRLAARWVGVAAIPVGAGRLTERERALAGGDDFSAMCAGASRLSRLQLAHRPGTSRENAARVGATIVGPFAASYAYWLIERSRESGIERLYHLSRDGELIHHVASALGAVTGGPAHHYLMGGRLPWQLAATGLPGGPTVEWLVDRTLSFYGRVTLEGCAARLGIPVDQLVDAMGGQRVTKHVYLTPEERSTLRTGLLRGHRELILDVARQHRDIALDYLRQEGLLGGNWALADVGWAGSTVRALNALLASEGHLPADVYFFGYTGGRDHPRLVGCDAFVWDSFADRFPPAGGPGLVEAMCSGSHGPVTGYEQDADGRVRARTRTEVGVAAGSWWLDEVRSGVVVFLEHLLATLAQTEQLPPPPERDTVDRFLSSLAQKPGPRDAIVLGACPREEDAQGDSVHRLARGYSWRDLPRLVQRGSMITKNLTWPAGALKLTPQPQRTVFRSTIATAALLRRWRN